MPEVLYFLDLQDDNEEDDAAEVTIANLHSAPLWCSGYDGLDPYLPDPEFGTVDLSVSSPLQSVRGRNSSFIRMLEDYPATSPHINGDLFDRENQVNFVIDLFHQRVEQSTIVVADLPSLCPHMETTLHEFERNDEMGLCLSNLGFDLGLELMIFADRNRNRNRNRDCPVMAVDADCSRGSGISGLRVVGEESDSDDSDNEVVGVDGIAEEEDFGLDSDGDDDDVGSLLLGWNSFELDDHRRHATEDFDWEEVGDREVLSLFFDPDLDEDLDTSVEGMLVLQSHQNMRNSEWEVLSNIPNFQSNPNPEHFDEYTADDYELLFGQFSENDTAEMGKPPASRNFVENLPSVILTEQDLCAVCKDEIIVNGEAKQLPCNHRYHSDCIIPWLGIRNTCPVCRHELPTDDLDYERRKTRRIGNAALR